MSIYTLIVIIGTLMIIGGISLAATPLMTFVTAGYFIIILFLLRVSSALSGRFMKNVTTGLLFLERIYGT